MKEADEEKAEKGGKMSFGKRMAALRKSKGRGKGRAKKSKRY